MDAPLITGATGLVGSALTRILQQEGHTPVLLARHQLTAEKAATLGIDPGNFVAADISEPQLGLSDKAYAELVKNTKTIFHLAARVDFKGHSVEDYRKTNIDGTKNIIQLARNSGALLHYTSTAFISGTNQRLSEDQFDISQTFRNGYEESKFLAEKAVRGFMTDCPGRTNIYRLAIILGRKAASSKENTFGPFYFMDAVFRMLLINKKQPDQLPLRILGDPNGHLPMLFCDQTAGALATLSQTKRFDQTYHLVPNKALLNSTLESLFNQAFGRQVVEWASQEDFAVTPCTRSEKILRKKTAVYADYLNLHVQYERQNLEAVLGPNALPCPNEDEFLSAFSDFLASKQDTEHQLAQPPPQLDWLDGYFNTFLVQFLNQQLLKNLVSLNADFWITIDEQKTWSLQIRQGCLTSIKKDVQAGTFGYRTDTRTYLRVAKAEISPQEAFFRGAIKLAGNSKEALRTATALEEFFNQYPYCPKLSK